MGLLDKIFGSKVNYPPLPAGNDALVKLDEVKAPLEELAQRAAVLPLARGPRRSAHPPCRTGPPGAPR